MADATFAGEKATKSVRSRKAVGDFRGLSIRTTLVLLIGILGLLLMGATGLHVKLVVHDYRLAQSLSNSKELRDGLLRASRLLSAEREVTFDLLTGRIGASGEAVAVARAAVDEVRLAAEAEMRVNTAATAGLDGVLELTVAFGRQLNDLRNVVDREIAATDSVGRATAAEEWFRGASGLIDAVQSLRIALLSQEEPIEAELRSLGLLRYYLGIAGDAQAENVILIDAALRNAAGTWWDAIVQRNAGRLDLAWQLISEELAAPLSPDVVAAMTQAIDRYRTSFRPLQESLIQIVAAGATASAERLGAWRGASEADRAQQEAAQDLLLAATTDRIDRHRAGLLNILVGWIALTIIGLAVVIVSALVIRNRVVRPLENLRISMLRLANNDLEAPVFHLHRFDEVGAMTDALRVFKANAIRRQRLQAEREHLNTELRSAYATMKADLEAAAVVQQAILPSTSQFDGVSIHQLFLASSVVAGDTFNILQVGSGLLIFFHVDVAGHGAAAALVSMASHHVLTRSAYHLTAGVPLSEVVATVNDEWPESLPYFTMIYGVIDVDTGAGRLVQAGHPPPFLIDGSGATRTIGDGGVPIGLLKGTAFEVTESLFTFRAGNRLILHSDGIVDAMNPAEERFGEERLEELVRGCARQDSSRLLAEIDRAVRAWRGRQELQDDVSVVIIERSGPKERK